ncbi:hypothetical protein [Sphingobium sp. B2D3C]|uniref:hypothetical protein n=1 Tax=Sphingobium sp. B2D3C TaxID=2940581 RepID=UPI0022243652|nr:hypothetical protein [Sphingobium sp. B2D3C]MCW2399671.1 hypothetical protein [Sphingobium sp. B2D3C]
MELSPIRLLRDDVAVWLIYAGSNRRFLDDFSNNNRVFLNIPGFDATPAAFRDDVLMRRHLAMSDAVNELIRGHTTAHPSRNPLDYLPNPHAGNTPSARQFAAEIGNITRLFKMAKIGDIVMSPGHGQFDPFLIGEISSNWSKSDDLVVPQLENEIVPTRRVRWINAVATRRDFAPRTARRLINRHAITMIDRRFYQDIFDNVYPSYSWRERSKLDLFGNGYAGKDPLQPYEAAKLLKYVMAAVFSYEDGEFDAFQALDIDAAILQFYDESRVAELAQNFNSPGKFTVTAKSGLAAILLAGGILMATGDPNANFAQQRAHVSAQVAGALQGANEAEAKTELDNFINSFNSAAWSPVQSSLGKSAKNTLDLTLDNSAEVQRHKDELNAK